MQDIHKDDIQHDERGRQARTIFEEPQIITFGLDNALILWDTIARYRLEWLAAPWGKYSPAFVH